MHLLLYLLAAILIALNGADWLTTRLILTTRDGREANPVMAWLIGRLGLNAALGLKVLMVAAIAIGLVVFTSACAPQLVAATLGWLDAVYVWVVYHNWRQLHA